MTLRSLARLSFWIAVFVAGFSLFCEDRLTFLRYSLLGLSLCALPDMIGYFRMINTSVHIINIDDKIAIRLAKEYNLDAEYIKCRRMGMSIANSLAEWDLLDMQKIHTLINEAQSGNFA